MVDDWENAVIIPILKKGDLKRCDNWCGIKFVGCSRKVMARIVKERLEQKKLLIGSYQSRSVVLEKVVAV